MNFRFGIKINGAFFVALSENDAFPFGKINVRAVELYEFSYADAGRNQKIYNRQISGMSAPVTELFNIFICKSFLYYLSRFYLVNAPDGAFYYIVFIFKPCKKEDMIRRILSSVTLLVLWVFW